MYTIKRFAAIIIFLFIVLFFLYISKNLSATLVLVIAGFLFYFSNILFSNNFSPISIFTLGWIFPSIFVVFLNENDRYTGWQDHDVLWFAILLSTAGFICGFLLVFIFKLRRLLEKGSLKELSNKLNFKKNESFAREKKITLYIIFLLFFLGIIGFINNLLNIVKAGGITVIEESGLRDSERIFGQSTIINYLYFLNPLVFVLSVCFLTRFGKNNRIKFISILSFLTLFFHGTRSTIIYPSIMAILSYLMLTNKKIKLHQIILVAVFFVFGFQLVTIGRNLPFIPVDASLFEILTYRIQDIFLYFTPAYSNLQAEILNLKSLHYGKESFQFINGLFNFFVGGGNENPNSSLDVEQFYLVHESFNTGTFLRENYRDFGFWGIFFFSLYYGALATFFYLKLLFKPTIKNVISYSIISVMLLVCFFSNQFFKVQYWYWISILFISYLFRDKNLINNMTNSI